MKKYHVALLVFVLPPLLWLFVYGDCHFNVTDEDRHLLQMLSIRHQDLNFKLDCDTYLRVEQSERGEFPDEGAITDIYKFFFQGGGTNGNRKTSFVYLNVYDRNKRFKYQVYGIEDGGLKKELRREYY